jgi:RNA polymerase sigma-70 factor, ECF subfamily
VIGWRRSRHYGSVKGPTLTLAGPVSRNSRADSSGDVRLTALVEIHFDFVWRLLRRQGLSEADADDAAQHVFMIAMEKLDRIADGSERTFLYGIALRVAANARRKTQRRAAVSETDPELDAARSPDRELELRRARSLLDELLEKLPEELRRVLVLAEIEQLEVPEIARLEAIPTGTAASRLRRAREKFRELLRAAEPRNPFKGSSDE